MTPPDAVDELGMARVREPAGVLPQAAVSLDADRDVSGREIAIDVDYLTLDSASFRDLRAHSASPEELRATVLDIVSTRGKMHNPRTGSGGMLVGRVAGVGPAGDVEFSAGDPVATLISLTATPLRILDGLAAWDGASEVVPVAARAIVPGPRAIIGLPADILAERALAILDVCGAAALTRRVLERPRISGPTDRVLLLGGGKSAVLAAAAAREHGVATLAAVPTDAEAQRLRELDVFDAVLVADATRPGELLTAVRAAGPLPDVTVVCVNAPGCEHGALVATRDGGAVIFFSMATSFTATALGAEAICRDLDLIVGSGYLPGHAATALDLYRSDQRVRAFFDHLPVSHPADPHLTEDSP